MLLLPNKKFVLTPTIFTQRLCLFLCASNFMKDDDTEEETLPDRKNSPKYDINMIPLSHCPCTAEGAAEERWMEDAGLGHLSNKIKAGNPITPAELQEETVGLTPQQVAAVKIRAETLNAFVFSSSLFVLGVVFFLVAWWCFCCFCFVLFSSSSSPSSPSSFFFFFWMTDSCYFTAPFVEQLKSQKSLTHAICLLPQPLPQLLLLPPHHRSRWATVLSNVVHSALILLVLLIEHGGSESKSPASPNKVSGFEYW